MAARVSLSLKLIVLCAGRVLIPVFFIGAFSFQQFKSFGETTTSMSYSALEKQAMEILRSGVEGDRSKIQTLLNMVENDGRKLAASPNLMGYLSASTGENEVLNAFARRRSSERWRGFFKHAGHSRDFWKRSFNQTSQWRNMSSSPMES